MSLCGAGLATPSEIGVEGVSAATAGAAGGGGSGVTASDRIYNASGTFTLNNSGAVLQTVFAADSGQVSIGGRATTGASTDGVDVGLHHVSINAGAYSLTGAAAAETPAAEARTSSPPPRVF